MILLVRIINPDTPIVVECRPLTVEESKKHIYVIKSMPQNLAVIEMSLTDFDKMLAVPFLGKIYISVPYLVDTDINFNDKFFKDPKCLYIYNYAISFIRDQTISKILNS